VVCFGGKFVVSAAGALYDAQARSLNWKFRVKPPPRYGAGACKVKRISEMKVLANLLILTPPNCENSVLDN
jgi:hypothetical protein